MAVQATNREAYGLFHEGVLTLAKMESNGIKIDVEYLKKTVKEISDKLVSLETGLRESDEFKTWEKRFGTKTKIGSRTQLGEVLFEDLDFEGEKTEKGRQWRTDDDYLAGVKLQFVRDYLKWCKFLKLRNTYLAGIEEEIQHGFIHPVFNLHLVMSFRSSSDSPNFQNIPIRDPETGKIIRQCFIAREGNHLVETDFSGAEVRVAACVVGSTLVETIDGPMSMEDLVSNLSQKSIYVYGYNTKKSRIGISKVLEGGITRRNAEVWKVVLDNGKEIKATPDHKFLLRTGVEIPLRELVPGTSLMPFYKTKKVSYYKTVYEKIYLNNGLNMLAHNLIAEDIYNVVISGSDQVVHHKDGNGCNNSLFNLAIMNRSDHMKIHVKQSWDKPEPERMGKRNQWHKSEEGREFSRRKMRERKELWTEKDWEEFSQRISEGLKRNGEIAGEKNPMYGKKHSEDSKRAISNSKKGKKTGYTWNKGLTKETDDRVKKISDAKKGKPPHNKGKNGPPLSEEAKKRISIFMTGRKNSEESRRVSSENMIKYWEKKQNETCVLCNREFRTISNTHLKHKHGMSLEEYRSTYNHKVVSIEFSGYEDVYNITVEGIHNYALEAGVIVKNCYHKDPAMLSYINDPSKDMHRDMAIQCYILSEDSPKEWWKKKGPGGGYDVRYCGKNGFVFPSFYGSVYFQIAPAMWKEMMDKKMTNHEGVPLKEHLRSKGIKKLGDCSPGAPLQAGTFVKHIKDVENDFWGRRFRVYNNWKKNWYNAYLKTGGFDLLTGFHVEGLMKRNEVINYPVQGAAFHCLLWVLIQLQKAITKKKMKTKLVGQIHDSIIADVCPNEVQEYLTMVQKITTIDLPAMWKWINVPIEIECEVCPIGESWWSKKQWVLNNEGLWTGK